MRRDPHGRGGSELPGERGAQQNKIRRDPHEARPPRFRSRGLGAVPVPGGCSERYRYLPNPPAPRAASRPASAANRIPAFPRSSPGSPAFPPGSARFSGTQHSGGGRRFRSLLRGRAPPGSLCVLRCCCCCGRRLGHGAGGRCMGATAVTPTAVTAATAAGRRGQKAAERSGALPGALPELSRPLFNALVGRGSSAPAAPATRVRPRPPCYWGGPGGSRGGGCDRWQRCGPRHDTSVPLPLYPHPSPCSRCHRRCPQVPPPVPLGAPSVPPRLPVTRAGS